MTHNPSASDPEVPQPECELVLKAKDKKVDEEHVSSMEFGENPIVAGAGGHGGAALVNNAYNDGDGAGAGAGQGDEGDDVDAGAGGILPNNQPQPNNPLKAAGDLDDEQAQKLVDGHMPGEGGRERTDSSKSDDSATSVRSDVTEVDFGPPDLPLDHEAGNFLTSLFTWLFLALHACTLFFGLIPRGNKLGWKLMFWATSLLARLVRKVVLSILAKIGFLGRPPVRKNNR